MLLAAGSSLKTVRISSRRARNMSAILFAYACRLPGTVEISLPGKVEVLLIHQTLDVVHRFGGLVLTLLALRQVLQGD